jgi:hypothetical protein
MKKMDLGKKVDKMSLKTAIEAKLLNDEYISYDTAISRIAANATDYEQKCARQYYQELKDMAHFITHNCTLAESDGMFDALRALIELSNVAIKHEYPTVEIPFNIVPVEDTNVAHIKKIIQASAFVKMLSGNNTLDEVSNLDVSKIVAGSFVKNCKPTHENPMPTYKLFKLSDLESLPWDKIATGLIAMPIFFQMYQIGKRVFANLDGQDNVKADSDSGKCVGEI